MADLSGLGKLLPKLVLLAVGAGAAAEFARLKLPYQYRPLFDAEAKSAGVDADLLHALALTENYHQDPAAIGPTNNNGTSDYGLMQINDTNFARLGLGTVADGLWRDPQHSVRAAAQLVRENMVAAPASGLLDQFSLYNAGVSEQGPRPKLTGEGLYVDGLYVWTGFLWYVAIVLSGLAPFGIKQQTTT